MYVKKIKCLFADVRVWLWMVQHIFISHNFHVRNKHAAHHPMLPATLDGATTNYYHRVYLFLSIFSWVFTITKTTLLNVQPIYYRVPRKHGDNGALPPPSSKIMPKHNENLGDIGKQIPVNCWG
jgi:hypothetical protein